MLLRSARLTLCSLVVVLVSLTACSAMRKWEYAHRYGTTEDHVTIEPMPRDCDWGTAPIGNKLCHYREQIRAENAQGQLIDGTDVQRRFSDTVGHIALDGGRPAGYDWRVVSYDGGKTWFGRRGYSADQGATWLGEYAADQFTDWRVARVVVSWDKVQE